MSSSERKNANAMMWPAILPRAPRSVWQQNESGPALLILCIIGAAITPQLFVRLKQIPEFQFVLPILMVPCDLYSLLHLVCDQRIDGRTSAVA